MTSVAWLNAYLCANVLLVLAAVLLRGLDAIGGRLRRPLAFRHRLAVGHALLAAAVLLPLAAPWSAPKDVLPRTAQVWSAATMHGTAVDAARDPRLALAVTDRGASLPLKAASGAAAGAVLLGLLVSLVRLGGDFRRTTRIIAEAQAIRRHGRVHVLISELARVPFSFWRPGRYDIVVPSSLVLQPGDLRMAVLHEAQHHRQQDTKWLYLYQLLASLFYWNPAVHRLECDLRALQELACDEALAARKSVGGTEYCRSLLRVAERAALRQEGLVQASMSAGGGELLKRRVEAVLSRPENHQRAPAVVATLVVAWSVLALVAAGCSSVIHDRRVSAEDAAAWAAARPNGSLPVVVNDAVVRQLNLLLATPDGRDYLRASLVRMRGYEAFIGAELAGHGLPLELSAIPLVESGYRNLPSDSQAAHGAGLWMFVAPTAKRFGLVVDAERDERLDVSAATGAAMRYFSELHRHFGDWNLAILAYNAGTARVEEGIRATGTRDVWRIIDAGYENDPDYVPRVMAAVLVLGNPSVLD